MTQETRPLDIAMDWSFKQSRAKLLGLTAFSFCLSIVGFLVLRGQTPFLHLEGEAYFLSYLAAPMGVLLGATTLYEAFVIKAAVFVVSQKGVQIARFKNILIPWPEIRGIRIFKQSHLKMLALDLSPQFTQTIKSARPLSRLDGWSMPIRQTEIVIPTTRLNTTPEAIVSLVQRHLQRRNIRNRRTGL